MIRTARLLLRRAEAGDVMDLHEILRDPQVMRYWSTPPHPDLATTQTWMARLPALDPATSKGVEPGLLTRRPAQV